MLQHIKIAISWRQAKAIVRGILLGLCPKTKGDNRMEQYRATARASAHKNSNFLAIAKALVDRNFYGIHFHKKGAIK